MVQVTVSAHNESSYFLDSPPCTHSFSYFITPSTCTETTSYHVCPLGTGDLTEAEDCVKGCSLACHTLRTRHVLYPDKTPGHPHEFSKHSRRLSRCLPGRTAGDAVIGLCKQVSMPNMKCTAAVLFPQRCFPTLLNIVVLKSSHVEQHDWLIGRCCDSSHAVLKAAHV